MSYTDRMLSSYSGETEHDRTQLATLIDKLVECTQACTMCVDACLSDGGSLNEEVTYSIRRLLDCADITDVTSRVLARHTTYDNRISHSQISAALQSVRACAESLGEQSAAPDTMVLCERVCRETELALAKVLEGIPLPVTVDLTAIEASLAAITPRQN